MNASRPAALLALVLSLPVLPALAQRSPDPAPLRGIGSSASLTGLRYEVIDLDARDGIRADVRFTGQSWAQAWAGTRYCGRFNGCVLDEGAFNEPAVATSGDAERGSFGAASPAGLFAAGHYEVERVRGHMRPFYAGEARLQGATGQPLFTLAAHTAVRVTAQYTLDAWSIPSTSYWFGEHLFGDASASVFFVSPFLDGPTVGASIGASAGRPGDTPDFEHQSGELTALFRNDADRTVSVWGRIGVIAGGEVPVVPEPSTWALLLGGLALLGARARRR